METLSIAYDSREQRPVHEYEGLTVNGQIIEYVKRPLSVYDYALDSDLTPTSGKLMHPGFSLERKSIPDFIGSFFNGNHAKREFAKVARARELWGSTLPQMYILEGDYEMIKRYNYDRFPSGRINAKVVISKINELRYRHNIHIVECTCKVHAEYTIISLLKKHSKSVQFKNAMKEKAKDTDYANKLV